MPVPRRQAPEGAFSFPVPPAVSTDYRVVYAGDGTYEAARLLARLRAHVHSQALWLYARCPNGTTVHNLR